MFIHIYIYSCMKKFFLFVYTLYIWNLFSRVFVGFVLQKNHFYDVDDRTYLK